MKSNPISLLADIIWTIYFWIVFIFVTIGIYAIIIIGCLPLKLIKPSKITDWAHSMATVWGKLSIAVMPIWKVSIEGKEKIKEHDFRGVIVCNHESMSDIWALYLLNTQFRWLSKASVFKIPVIGHAQKLSGCVPVERGNKESHKNAMQTSYEKLIAGKSMAFFPEGTRSRDGKVKEFKSGAFRLAQKANVGILPVCLTGANEMIKPGSPVPKKAHLKMKIFDPIPASIVAETPLDELMKNVRTIIVDGVEELKN